MHELNFNKSRKTWLRSGYFYFLFIMATLSGFLILTNLDYAKEVTVNNELDVVSSTSPAPRFTILQKIQEGIGLLKNSIPLQYETKNKKPSGELIRKQIALVILNTETGEVFEKRVWAKEQEIKNYKRTGVINLESSVQSSTSNNSNWNVHVSWWNSFNTFYKIANHPELVVVANKYLLPSKNLSGLPEKSNGPYTEIIYIPYSSQLHLSELVEAGKTYLKKNIDRAFTELEAAGVKSRLLPNASITEGISKNFIQNIIIVEHMDPDGFAIATDGGKELGERVLTIIGANQENAYRYTGSPAGASGLAQFIKPTYKNIVAKYPEAHLIKDYNTGMADHTNAIKAMVLFFDSHKKEITSKITKKKMVKSIGISEEMLAATYNGGPGKVVRSVNKFGLAWISGQLNLSRTNRILKQETLNYIKKLQAIKNLDLFANISVN